MPAYTGSQALILKHACAAKLACAAHEIGHDSSCRRQEQWKHFCSTSDSMMPDFMKNLLCKLRFAQLTGGLCSRRAQHGCNIEAAFLDSSLYSDFLTGLRHFVYNWQQQCISAPSFTIDKHTLTQSTQPTALSWYHQDASMPDAANSSTTSETVDDMDTTDSQATSHCNASPAQAADMDQVDCEPHSCTFMRTSAQPTAQAMCMLNTPAATATLVSMPVHCQQQAHMQHQQPQHLPLPQQHAAMRCFLPQQQHDAMRCLFPQQQRPQQQLEMGSLQSPLKQAQAPLLRGNKRRRVHVDRDESPLQASAAADRPGKRQQLMQPNAWQTES